MILMKAEAQPHISPGLMNPFKSEPYYSISLALANSIHVFGFGSFVCLFQDPDFPFHLSGPTWGFSVHQVFEYAQTLFVGKFKFILTGLYKIQSCGLHVYVPGLGLTFHNSYKIQYLLKIQRLVCMESIERPQGWWCLKPRKLNVILNSAKLQLLIKFLWERTLWEIKTNIRTLI